MDKVLTTEECLAQQSFWDRLNAKNWDIVLTNGCFDLLHVGHLRTLAQAENLGTALVVALNSDESVRMLKGADHPIIPQDERAEMLAALYMVSYVVIYDGNILPLIRAIKPKVLAKGDDWVADDVAGKSAIESLGGRVAIIPRGSPKTTTEIISQIKEMPDAITSDANSIEDF